MLLTEIPQSTDKLIREYYHENGCVFLYRGKQFYFFKIEKKLSPARTLIHERGRIDYITAYEFFDTATRYIRDEIKWTEPVRKYSCKYNQKHSRGCTDDNCPRALGGADYRYIFGISCPFRNIPHTR